MSFRTVHLGGDILRLGGVSGGLIVRGLGKDGVEREGLGEGPR